MTFPLSWLRWTDCAGPCFSETDVRARVEGLARQHPRSPQGLVDAVSATLVDEVGPWAVGFTWAPNGGGVVRSWCCPAHSVPVGTPPPEVAERVIRALAEWQGQLLDLQAQFRALDERTRTLETPEALRCVAAALLPWVLARNMAEDAWYATFELVLGWWLESSGRDRTRYGPVAERVIAGRFSSWVEPSAEVAEQVCTELGLALAVLDDEPPPVRDGWQTWTVSRRTAFRSTPPEPAGSGHDAHLRVVGTREAERDPVRAARLTAALLGLRAHSAAGAPLDRAALGAANAAILGVPSVLRTTDAWAKGGTERYALPADLPAALDRSLREAHAPALAVATRAVRLYLDLCFLHPFEDGNARTARVAFDALVWGAGYQLGTVGPLFSLERSPDDVAGADTFVWVVARMLVGRGDARGGG